MGTLISKPIHFLSIFDLSAVRCLCAAVAAVTILEGCSIVEPRAPEFGPNVRQGAIRYLDTLPPDQMILVWPSRLRVYKVLTNDPKMPGILDEYILTRKGPFQAVTNSSFSNVTVAVVTHDYDKNEREQLLAGASVRQAEGDFILSQSETSSGCAAKLEFSRATWIDSGVGLLSEDRVGRVGSATMKECLYAVLDFINGFPVKGNSFTPNGLPDVDVRNAVMWALRKCSLEATAEGATEQTRDGVFPFPSVECAKNILATP